MALTTTGVPDIRVYFGPSLQAKLIQCQPAVSDYPIGGWVLTAEQIDFGNGHLLGGEIWAQAYSASSSPSYQVNLPASSFGTAPQPSTTSLSISAFGSGASGSLSAEIPASTDLSAYPFWLMAYGY